MPSPSTSPSPVICPTDMLHMPDWAIDVLLTMQAHAPNSEVNAFPSVCKTATAQDWAEFKSIFDFDSIVPSFFQTDSQKKSLTELCYAREFYEKAPKNQGALGKYKRASEVRAQTDKNSKGEYWANMRACFLTAWGKVKS